MDTPTKTAVAGKFQSKDGADLIQFCNGSGTVVCWIDCDGVLHIDPNGFVASVGTAQITSGLKT